MLTGYMYAVMISRILIEELRYKVKNRKEIKVFNSLISYS